MSGIGVVGRDKYGVFPLRGKLLNVRDATPKQVMDNNEVNCLLLSLLCVRERALERSA